MKTKNLLLVLLISSISFQSIAHKQKWDDCTEDWSELMKAIYKNKEKKYKKLIDEGVDVNFFTTGDPCRYVLSALSVAIRSQNLKATTNLLETGKVEYIDFIFTASCYNSVEIVQVLLQHGADPNKELNENHHTNLMSCSSHATLDIFKEVLDKTNDVDIQESKSGFTALMYAAMNGEIEKVKLLLEKGADKSIKDYEGLTAYHHVLQDVAYDSISKEKAEVLIDLLKP